MLSEVKLTGGFAISKTRYVDFLCHALQDSIFSYFPIYVFFFNILKGCFHIFSLGQHSSLGKPIWPPLSTLSLVLFLFLLSTDSVYHYILGSLCTLVQFDFHPWKQLPYITEPSLPLRVWGHDVVFLRGGMRSLWVTCDDTVFHFLDLSQEQILYVDKNQSPQKISLFIH